MLGITPEINEATKVNPMTPEKEDRCLKAAKQAALVAGKIQMASFGKVIQVDIKGTSIDLVTAVDKECDAAIVDVLRKACPDILFVTEETFQEGQSIDLSNTWVVDPLDGTTNYAHGFPHFAVSIAYFFEGVPQIGVVYDPLKKEMFYALKNRGAFLNDQPVFVSKNRVHTLDHALLATGFPYDIATSSMNNIDHFQRIAPKCHGVRRPGAAALDLAYVASGRLDAFWELKLSVWDIAAGILLVEEAGGLVTNPTGGAVPYGDRRIHLVGSNGNGLHQEIQALLGEDA
ncbi:inositol monophosphatase family protein [Vampirovibrio sp.]|uniref:inositol monophosphatase family protein n=1 Tax=Vampirovibrio sp. TaxID=2717857 RepID=UPI003593280E